MKCWPSLEITPRVSSSISSSSSVNIRIQLADCDLDDCRLPARKADALWSHNYITTGRLPLTASVAGLKDSLFYVYEKFTNCRFLVDTGAEVSVLPASALDTHAAQQGPTLTAANGTRIRTYGNRTIPVHLSGGIYKWSFIIADVARPLLGADFLRSKSLLVDLTHKRLIDATTFASGPIVRSNIPAPHLNAITITKGHF